MQSAVLFPLLAWLAAVNVVASPAKVVRQAEPESSESLIFPSAAEEEFTFPGCETQCNPWTSLANVCIRSPDDIACEDLWSTFCNPEDHTVDTCMSCARDLNVGPEYDSEVNYYHGWWTANCENYFPDAEVSSEEEANTASQENAAGVTSQIATNTPAANVAANATPAASSKTPAAAPSSSTSTESKSSTGTASPTASPTPTNGAGRNIVDGGMFAAAVVAAALI